MKIDRDILGLMSESASAKLMREAQGLPVSATTNTLSAAYAKHELQDVIAGSQYLHSNIVPRQHSIDRLRFINM